MTTPFPATLFVPHGAPSFALRPGAAGAALAAIAASLPTPRAIIVISPHWETGRPRVGGAAAPETIHDFYGFPEALYAIRYPARGAPEIAEQLVSALGQGGFDDATIDPVRGLDHGAWVPLGMMYPRANVPVIPLSVQSDAGPVHAWRIGQALAPLVRQGCLVIGTGSITHNLRDWQLTGMSGATIPAYVTAFPDWIADRLAAGDLETLLDYRRQAPDSARAHPTEEHLLPLFTALGAAGAHASAERLYRGTDSRVIAMDAWTFAAH